MSSVFFLEVCGFKQPQGSLHSTDRVFFLGRSSWDDPELDALNVNVLKDLNIYNLQPI